MVWHDGPPMRYKDKYPDYQIKLVCLNCGIKDFYQMLFGSEFMPYVNAEESDSHEREYSYIHVGGLKEDKGTDHEKNCRSCNLPFLCLDYWDASEAPEQKTKVKHG